MIDETYNKFQDEDGCPDFVGDAKGIPDTDGDGISDYVDSCPNQPETYNGVFDSDGCPDDSTSHDSDRDGIADEFDQCRLSAETYNKFQDADGCPDTTVSSTFFDADGDGITDTVTVGDSFDGAFLEFTVRFGGRSGVRTIRHGSPGATVNQSLSLTR